MAKGISTLRDMHTMLYKGDDNKRSKLQFRSLLNVLPSVPSHCTSCIMRYISLKSYFYIQASTHTIIEDTSETGQFSVTILALHIYFFKKCSVCEV